MVIIKGVEMVSDYLPIELKTDKLVSLIESGVISGADIHCADPAIKALIQEVCLKACIIKICSQCDQHESCSLRGNEMPEVKKISFSQRPPSH